MSFKLSEVLILSFIFNEFCSQFCIKMLLYYYLKMIKGSTTTDAMSMFHFYSAFFHLSVVMVNVICNTRLGEYGTISVLSALSVAAYLTMFFIEMRPPLENSSRYIRAFMFVTIAISTGGNFTCIKYVCISQYQFPSEALRYKKMMFIMVLFRYLGEIYGGLTITLFSSLVNPKSVIAPSIFVLLHKVIGTVILMAGYKVFLRREKRRNYIADFIKNSYFALKRKLTHRKSEAKEEGEFTINDHQKINMIYHVLPLFVPVVFILAYKEQKFTKFVYQSEAMSSHVANIRFHPLLMVSFYPVFIIFGVLIFHSTVVPITLKYRYNFANSQTRAITSFMFLVLSYAAASILEVKIEKDRAPVFEPGEAILMLFNSLPCPAYIRIQGNFHKTFHVRALSFAHIFQDNIDNSALRSMTINIACFGEFIEHTHLIAITEQKMTSFLIVYNFETKKLLTPRLEYEKKHIGSTADPHLWVIYHIDVNSQVSLIGRNILTLSLWKDQYSTPAILVPSGHYDVLLDGGVIMSNILLNDGAFYALMLVSGNESAIRLLTTKTPKEVTMLTQIPQIFFMSMTDALISSPGFVYNKSKVPPQWAELMVSLWFIAGFVGNFGLAIVFKKGYAQRELYTFITAVIIITICIGVILSLTMTVYKDYEEKVKRMSFVYTTGD